tara:strand:+ start:3096 stop:3539 length:444 start_codon:yes stop_codon:yes gene_type:complete
MNIVWDIVEYYIDERSAISLYMTCSNKLCAKKRSVAIIERWWINMYLKEWISKIVELLPSEGYKGNTFNKRCSICKSRCLSEVIVMNNKTMFTCFACFAGVESDLVAEVFPQLYIPLHSSFHLYKISGVVQFNPIYTDWQYENCRTQ